MVQARHELAAEAGSLALLSYILKSGTLGPVFGRHHRQLGQRDAFKGLYLSATITQGRP